MNSSVAPGSARVDDLHVARWVRILRRADRLVWRLFRAHEVLRDEILRAFVAPEQHGRVTDLAYREDASIYLPGGRTFERGLFAWELAAFECMKIQSGTRVLLGGAGGGREVRGLAELGAKITALEPNAVLRAAAEEVARQFTDVLVRDGSYEDLPTFDFNQGGRDSLPCFDAFVFGWGSFTHITNPSSQLAALQVARRLVGEGFVLLSFFVRPELEDSRADHIRRTARRCLKEVCGGFDPPPGLAYDRRCGFLYKFTRSEIEQLASDAGFSLVRFESTPYAHAILRGRPLRAVPPENTLDKHA